MTVQTFAQIEEEEGIHYDKTQAQISSLTAWYDAVREKRFPDFSVEDWCRSVRQDMYLEYVIGYALAALRTDPLAGELYDGELANAFTSVSLDFWSSHEKERQEIIAIFRTQYERYPDDIQRNIDATLRRWNKEELNGKKRTQLRE